MPQDLSQFKADWEAATPLAWVYFNEFVTENQKPVEYTKHRFLIEPMNDFSPDLVVKKSAQCGFSVLAILKSFWMAKYKGVNVGYILPTKNIVSDFVSPKVNPLIHSNPLIKKMVSKDSETLKQVGDRFVYFRGAFSEREAIAISLDVLMLDELDRMPDMNVVNIYDSRLQASEYGWRWRFSNPSEVGFGVDSLFQDSDQKHWMITCEGCEHEWFLDWESDGQCHYVDRVRKEYVCGECQKVLTNKERQNGRWCARYPLRTRRGYWINQLMCPWVTAKRVIEQYEESNIQFFYNFVLGKAFTPTDLVVNRETILRATAPSTIPRIGVALGVDQNVNEQIWVAATTQGVFAHGKAKSWEEIEHLKLMWNAVTVIDPMPYPTKPKQLAEKYPDIFLCQFKEMKGIDIVQFKGKTVYADRTRLLDTVATEISEAKLLFRERPSQLEDYIADWGNIYRTTEEKDDGHIKSIWKKKENRDSDFSFATAYMRIALGRLLGGHSTFVEPTLKRPWTDTRVESGVLTTVSKAVQDTFDLMD